MPNDLSLTTELDQEGFLKDLSSWTKQVAIQIAVAQHIQLTSAHWEVIHLIRNFYRTYGICPSTRVLVNRMGSELGEDKGRSVYLMGLFPNTPLKTLSKIAGLPKPPNCD